MSDAEAAVGLTKAELDTPALLVDLDLLEANIARIAAACREHGVRWRPHAKAHKCPDIARLEIAAGAIGVTCAKLSEAEVMAAAGIRDVLIANQIVGAQKIRRLVGLLDRADVIVAVDSAANVAELGEAAAGQGRTSRVVIEVDVGMRRAGVAPGGPVVALADEIAKRPGLRLAGVMGWESHAVLIADPAEKERAVRDAVALLTSSAEACRRAGHPVEIVSCGGTGTFPYCIRQPGVTEVQVGGAVFSDVHYRTHYHVDFPPALTILTTVTSRPTPTRIVLDAGKKAMSGDAALPQPLGLEPVASLRLSAEHATVELAGPSELPRVGDPVELVVGYTDTTVHLHERILGVRGGMVETAWPVSARGKLT
jgi:D-serine deaminase-like pyridoxal phosphate-dependent protein